MKQASCSHVYGSDQGWWAFATPAVAVFIPIQADLGSFGVGSALRAEFA